MPSHGAYINLAITFTVSSVTLSSTNSTQYYLESRMRFALTQPTTFPPASHLLTSDDSATCKCITTWEHPRCMGILIVSFGSWSIHRWNWVGLFIGTTLEPILRSAILIEVERWCLFRVDVWEIIWVDIGTKPLCNFLIEFISNYNVR